MTPPNKGMYVRFYGAKKKEGDVRALLPRKKKG